MSDAKGQSIVRIAKMIRPLNRFGTLNEYRHVEYYGSDWQWMVECGWVTMEVSEVIYG